jgi:hypothetical protein
MAHASARLTPRRRRLQVDRVAGGWSVTRAAAAGISRKIGSKWWWRFAREGKSGWRDRRSAMHRRARQHPPELVAGALGAGSAARLNRSRPPNAYRV